MSKILIINAGWEQETLVMTAKEMGHYIIATHTKEDATGFKYADKTYIVDPKELLILLEIAKTEKIEGVISDQCDFSLFATAFISEQLKLPGIKITTAQLVTNKARSRRRLNSNKQIKQPNYRICENLEETKSACNEIKLPVVIKPTDNRGSIGVSKITNDSEIQPGYMIALAQSNTRNVIVEQFIEGKEIAADGYFFKGSGHKILSISSKTHSENGLFDSEIITPPEISENALKKVKQMNSYVVQELGIDFGATHIEYMITPKDDVYLMEAHNRGGGVNISDKVNPVVSGINTSKCLIQDCLGVEYKGIKRTEKNPYTLIKFLTLPPGILLDVKIPPKIKEKDYFITCKIYANLGEELPRVKDCATRHGFIIVSGKNKKALYQNFEEIYNQLELKYDKKAK